MFGSQEGEETKLLRNRHVNSTTKPSVSSKSAPVASQQVADVVISSGVPFCPPSQKYWRIGGKWYDFSEFNHPGGKESLLMARDRFEDATFVFESHHHNYKRARLLIKKYEVPEEVALKTVRRRPTREERSDLHHDAYTDHDYVPKLLPDDAFYSVIRTRVTDYLREVGCPKGGPTQQCIYMFWACFAAWCGIGIQLYLSGTIMWALVFGLISSWLGGFGHNWVHQPKYKELGWALLSLDTIGFSSEGWFREHNLQHHM